MICMCLSTVKIRGSDGVVRKIGKGEIFIPKNPEVVKPLIERGKIRIVESSPTPPTVPSPGRLATLEEVMSATLLMTRDKIIKGGQWRHSTETQAAEVEIDRQYAEVMAGKGKLIDFSEACKRWMLAGTEVGMKK